MFEPAPASPGFDSPDRYRIETWGCQMNQHDSEKMAGILAAQGLIPAGSEADADVILLNTCAVREKAAEKVFARLGALRQLKARRSRLVLGVCGCVAQIEQEAIFRRAPHVDFVMGPRHVASLGRLVAEARSKRHQIAVLDPRDRLLPEDPAVALRTSRARAYVTVMEGCNKACTFCIVPATRGREACRPPGSILDESARAASEGYPEIELLGQTVNAWRHGAWDFTRLLGAVARTPDLTRLRFTTSHPLHFKTSIADLMAREPVLCPHVHLPVQSGSDEVLARMRRGYTRRDYVARVKAARERMPGLVFSTDIIVGFPGETEQEFAETLSLVQEVGFAQVYAFVYSPRPGTAALSLSDDTPPAVKKERLRRLLDLQSAIQQEVNSALVGGIEEVLVEGPSVLDPNELTGRTRSNKIVNFPGPPELTGTIVGVLVLRAAQNSLVGEIADSPPGVPLTSSLAGDITNQESPMGRGGSES